MQIIFLGSSCECLMWECLGVNCIFYSEIILNVSCQRIYLFGEMSCNNLVIWLLSQKKKTLQGNTRPQTHTFHGGILITLGDL